MLLLLFHGELMGEDIGGPDFILLQLVFVLGAIVILVLFWKRKRIFND